MCPPSDDLQSKHSVSPYLRIAVSALSLSLTVPPQHTHLLQLRRPFHSVLCGTCQTVVITKVISHCYSGPKTCVARHGVCGVYV